MVAYRLQTGATALPRGMVAPVPHGCEGPSHAASASNAFAAEATDHRWPRKWAARDVNDAHAAVPPLPFFMRSANWSNWINQAKPDGSETENCSIFGIVLR